MTNITESAKQLGPIRTLLRTMAARLASGLQHRPARSGPFDPEAASVYLARPPLPDSQIPEANPYVLAIGGALCDAGYRISRVDAGKVLDAVQAVHERAAMTTEFGRTK